MRDKSYVRVLIDKQFALFSSPFFPVHHPHSHLSDNQGLRCCEPYGDTTDFAGSDLSEVKHDKT